MKVISLFVICTLIVIATVSFWVPLRDLKDTDEDRPSCALNQFTFLEDDDHSEVLTLPLVAEGAHEISELSDAFGKYNPPVHASDSDRRSILRL